MSPEQFSGPQPGRHAAADQFYEAFSKKLYTPVHVNLSSGGALDQIRTGRMESTLGGFRTSGYNSGQASLSIVQVRHICRDRPDFENTSKLLDGRMLSRSHETSFPGWSQGETIQA
jgi:hypothetical protein